MYFDQLTAVYNHYTVMRSKITIQAVPTTTGTGIFGVYIDDDTTVTPTLAQDLCEQNSSAYRLVCSAGSQGQPITVSKVWDAVQAFGPSTLANDDLQGNSGANPVEQQYFTIFVQDSPGAAVTTFNCLVTVEYLAIWDELKNINSS